IFVATFLYCLLVLRTIRHAEGAEAFVPHLSVTLGVLLAVFSLGVLIYFIHHVSVAIQANEIIARLSQELCAGIEQLFPEPAGTPAPKSAEPAAENGVPVPAQHSGYLQFIDLEALLALARQHDLVLRLACRPGEHLITGQPLLWAQPPSADAASLTDAVNAAFVLGNQRTAGQDLLFVVNQLVEIA